MALVVVVLLLALPGWAIMPDADASETGNGSRVAEVPVVDGCLTSLAVGTRTRLRVAYDGLNLRSGPGVRCTVIGELPEGVWVSVSGERIVRDGYEWAWASTPLGEGFVFTGSLQPASIVVPEPVVMPSAVPVLMYHDIGWPADRYRVSPAQLAEQLDWLRANGYTSITPSDLVAYLDFGVPLPARPVILSIDDGWLSTLEFASLLAQYGFRGTYMLPNYTALTTSQIAALADSGEICGHSVSHQFLGDLPYETQLYEVGENKRWLEQVTGREISCFSYPFGSFSETTKQIVRDVGFRIAFHAWWGPAPMDSSLDRWAVQRIEVSGEYSLTTLLDVMDGV